MEFNQGLDQFSYLKYHGNNFKLGGIIFFHIHLYLEKKQVCRRI